MKKWTYLVAAGMLLGATPVFTGCIDNDEPEGITILRGAKAELLKAKAAVEAAKVAQVQADAALTQAAVKVKEAEAIKIQAEAKRIEAEAKIAEAQAALLNAQTESEKARLQGIIEENQRAQKEWEEKAAVRAAEAEAAIKEAEYRILEARTKYQQALAWLQTSQQRILQPYMAKLETATTNYFDALDDLRVAQRNVNKQDAVVKENEASKERLTRRLKKDVMLKEAALKGEQEAQKVAEEALAEAKTLKPSDLVVKGEEILKKRDEIFKQISDLEVEAAEKIASFITEGRFEEVLKLHKEANEAYLAPQTIAAVEFDFGDGAGYPYYVQRGKVFLPEAEYSLADFTNYTYYQEELEQIVSIFKSWTRDENDNAWTQERIVKMEGQLAELEKSITTSKKAWQEAVAAYNTNKYNTSDMTKISGYDKVVAEITAFNKAADALNKALAEQVRLEKKQLTDSEAFEAAKAANLAAQTEANKKADDDYTAAMKVISETVATKKANLKTAMEEAAEASTKAKNAYDTAKAKDPDSAETAAALAAWTTAENAAKAAKKAHDDYDFMVEINAIETARANAKLEAKKAREKADLEAEDAYDKLWDENKGTDYANLETAKATVITAQAAMDTAEKNLDAASKTYNNNISEYEDETGATPIDLTIISTLAEGTYNDEAGYVVRKTDLTASKLIVLNKEALIYVVKVRSEELYGTSIWRKNAYGDFEARLKELKDDEIIKFINETMDEMIENEVMVNLSTYNRLCGSYGLAGDRLALKETIRIAKSWLNNGKLIQGKIDQAQKALDDLTNAFEANEKAFEGKVDVFNVAYETLISDIETATEPMYQKMEELKPLWIVYQAIQDAKDGYENAGETMWTEDAINERVAECEALVELYKINVYDSESALMCAQNRLEKWNSDALTRLEILQDALEEAQAKVDRKKKELDNAQAALDAILATLSAE